MTAMAKRADTEVDDRETRTDVPRPDDPRKPESPSELTKPSWRYVVRKTIREFSDDECTDLAAALIVGVVLLAAAGVAALAGKKRMSRAGPPVPTQAVANVREDVQALRHGSGS